MGDNEVDHNTTYFDHLTAPLNVESKNIIGTWSDKLKFHLSSNEQNLHLNPEDFPDISLTIYPSI